jgi:hydrogenase nickel incorporation protein HypA/HybF
MHELSIAQYLVDLVGQQLSHELQPWCLPGPAPPAAARSPRVRALHLKIGALSCVHRDSLLFSFELAAEGTLAEGANLQIETVPVEIYCAECQDVVQLPGIQSFQCPICGTPSADIRSGRELDLIAIEIDQG